MRNGYSTLLRTPSNTQSRYKPFPPPNTHPSEKLSFINTPQCNLNSLKQGLVRILAWVARIVMSTQLDEGKDPHFTNRAVVRGQEQLSNKLCHYTFGPHFCSIYAQNAWCWHHLRIKFTADQHQGSEHNPSDKSSKLARGPYFRVKCIRCVASVLAHSIHRLGGSCIKSKALFT